MLQKIPRYCQGAGRGEISAGAVHMRESKVHGLGVFALRDFELGDIVELCPVIVYDMPAIEANAFNDFRMTFDTGISGDAFYRNSVGTSYIDASAVSWPPIGDDRPPRVVTLALGAGPIYNHAARPEDHNLSFCLHPGIGVISMQATKSIKEGDELFIDYGTSYWQGRNIQPAAPK